jgi:hypothetical protein
VASRWGTRCSLHEEVLKALPHAHGLRLAVRIVVVRLVETMDVRVEVPHNTAVQEERIEAQERVVEQAAGVRGGGEAYLRGHDESRAHLRASLRGAESGKGEAGGSARPLAALLLAHKRRNQR